METTNVPTQAGGLYTALNEGCACVSLDEAALARELEQDPGARGLGALIRERNPHLFASLPVYVSRRHLDAMAAVAAAAEAVASLPAYRDTVLEWAPDIARLEPNAARGVFFGYDFHLGPDGPRLIEINTNAGGALLNAALARAQHACCPAIDEAFASPFPPSALQAGIVDMFREEWRLARGAAPLRSIAIVDDAPESQYLYAEFLLFQRLFERHGIRAVVAAPESFEMRDARLWCGDIAVDLVYNRLTDFALAEPRHAALRAALVADAAVLTPHPRAHALLADKRNLIVLGDAARLRALGAAQDDAAILAAGIPHTELVSPQNAAQLWADRRALFFKPAAGHGGKAAYRGEKLTRRVWDEIVAGKYIAQALVPPSERLVQGGDSPLTLKLDVRNYAYAGRVQAVAARLYQGQTTNFRTAGGGFAPVLTGK